MDFIVQMNSELSKGWNCIFLGKTPPQAAGREKFVQTTLDRQTGKELGYVRTERVFEEVQVNEQVLNDTERRLNLRFTNRYQQGLFYDGSNPQTRMIDMITTILLAADRKALAKSSLSFIEKSQLNGSARRLGDYMSTPQLMECYGSARILQQHWGLYDEYLRFQKLLNLAEKRKFEA